MERLILGIALQGRKAVLDTWHAAAWLFLST